MSWFLQSMGVLSERELPSFPHLELLSEWQGEEKSAAVCVVFLPSGETGSAARLLLTKRSHKVRTHKGQMSLPGGLREAGDNSPRQTALRELEEELGVCAQDVHVYGQMPALKSKHGVTVVPVVMSAPWLWEDFSPQMSEVAEIVLPSWWEFQRSRLRYSWLPRWVGALKGYPLESGHWVWGLTAEIMRRLDLQK